MKKYHTLKWFQNRIGKRVFRNWHKCCNQCDYIAKNGLIIQNKTHADYLYNVQNDFGAEGTILNYRDKL